MKLAIKRYDDEPPMPALERHAWPNRWALTVASPFVLTAAILVSPTAGAAENAPRVNTLRAPEGGIQPQAAVGREGTLHLIYFLGDPAPWQSVLRKVGREWRQLQQGFARQPAPRQRSGNRQRARRPSRARTRRPRARRLDGFG